MNRIFLGIGTNLGDRENNLKQAIAAIENQVGHVHKSSSVYETEPWGFQSDDAFLNMVIMAETELSPHELLDNILSIELSLGRIRNDKRYSSRIIDIDILLYNEEIIDDAELKVPHPQLQSRKFVLIPLCEIAGEMRHPVGGSHFRNCWRLVKIVVRLKDSKNLHRDTRRSFAGSG